MADHQNTALVLSQLLQLQALLGPKGEGLFAKDMLALFKRLTGYLEMRIRRRGNTNGIHVRVIQDHPIIPGGVDPGISGPDRCQSVLIQIRAYHDPAVLELMENTDMIGAPMPAPNYAYTYQDIFLSLPMVY